MGGQGRQAPVLIRSFISNEVKIMEVMENMEVWRLLQSSCSPW